MTLQDIWKKVKTFWTYTLTSKSRWIILIILAVILLSI